MGLCWIPEHTSTRHHCFPSWSWAGCVSLVLMNDAVAHYTRAHVWLEAPGESPPTYSSFDGAWQFSPPTHSLSGFMRPDSVRLAIMSRFIHIETEVMSLRCENFKPGLSLRDEDSISNLRWKIFSAYPTPNSFSWSKFRL